MLALINSMRTIFLPMLVLGISCCSLFEEPVDEAADRFLELALALDVQDPGYVDIYFGRKPSRTSKKTLLAIQSESLALIDELALMTSARSDFLIRQLRAMVSRIEVLEGRPVSFDEELEKIYGLPPPSRRSEQEAQLILKELESKIPGEGPLHERFAIFQSRLVVPKERLDDVVRRCLTECRRRTLTFVTLPKGESIDVKYVSDKPWASYHRYLGEFKSVLEINRDASWTVGSVLDAVCHESYPGHHVWTILADKHFIQKGWEEHRVQLLRSPQAVVNERLATSGLSVLFDEQDRMNFIRELYDYAGLDVVSMKELNVIDDLVQQLRPFIVEGARRYYDGELDRVGAAIWLEKFALIGDAWSFLRFVDYYGSFVVSYTLEDYFRSWTEFEKFWTDFYYAT